MLKVLVNYNYTPDWIGDEDYLIYDRSDSKDYLKDFDQSKIIYTRNIGNVDYDKLSYLVDNYDELPDVFLWGKTNLFKYITPEEFNEVKDNGFTPLLTRNHKVYSDRLGVVCYYDEKGMYRERNDSWFLSQQGAKYVNSFDDWCRMFQIKPERYIPFPPGGNFILNRGTVHKYSRDLYHDMMKTMDYCQTPGEAQCAERSYYLMWR